VSNPVEHKTMLTLENVGISYKSNRGVFGEAYWALKDVSFQLNQGDSLGIIGRNGVGKSSLLRMIAGLIKPDAGSFTNHGYDVSLLCMQLGFTYYLTGRENIILSGMLMGMRRNEIMEKMDDIIAFAELGRFIDQPIATYSSGMVARLGFSIAFQADPDILLIDEVLGVGDAEFSHKSALMMQEKIKSNKTIVFVSHHAVLVEQLCNRAVWIEEGVTRAEGDTHEVLEQYNRFLNLI